MQQPLPRNINIDQKYMRIVHLFICFLTTILFSLISGISSIAQTGYFETIKESNLLNSNYINHIYQDSYGYIWISTGFGLNCYNGYGITSLSIPSPFSSVPVSLEVTQVLEDTYRNLWIATSTGLASYNLVTQQFKWHSLKNEKTNIEPIAIQNLFLDKNKSLCVLTSDACYQYLNETRIFKNLGIPASKNGSYRNMVEDRNGNLWITNKSELMKWDIETSQSSIYSHNIKNPHSIGDLDLNGLFVDHEGNLWVALSSGLNKYIASKDCFERHESVGGVLSIAEDKQGIIWLATWEDGLCKYNPHSETLSKFLNNPEDPFSILSNSIKCISFDSTGNLWIGTNGNGVNIYNKNYWRFKQFRSIPGNSNSLNNNVIRSFAENDKVLWIGTEDGGLNAYNQLTGKFAHYFNITPPVNKRSSLVVLAICEDNNQQLWLGTVAGLHKFNPSKGGYEFQSLSCLSDILTQIWCITKDENGILWLGTSEGLVRFDSKSKQTELFKSDQDNRNSISNNGIPSILALNNGKLWIGTKNGLNYFDSQTKQFKQYLHNEKETNSIADNSINHIFLSSNGDIWIATNNGLSKYNAVADNFTNINTQNWPSSFLLGILEDHNKNLWISSHQGIIHVDSKGKLIKAYDINDGLQSNQFLAGAFLKSKNGEMFFGGVNGFNSFKANEIKINTTPPQIQLNSLFINNQEVKAGSPRSPLSESLQSTKKITLNYNQNTFNLGFTALNYIHSEKSQYAYKLEGFNNEWINCGTRRMAFFTNVPYGKYQFHVKACNSDGIWNEKGIALEIMIRPPIWARWWARVIYFLIPIVLLYFFRKYSIIAVEVKNALKLEKLEKEKVKEVYNLKMRFFMNISHEFRTPLTLIIDPIENALTQLGENSSLRKTLALSHKNALRMLGLVNQLLEFRKIETGNTALKITGHDIVDFTENLAESFREKAEKHRITFETRSAQKPIMLWFDAEKMDIILFNLLSNAFKYTPEHGRITISISVGTNVVAAIVPNRFALKKQTKQTREYVQIEVEDTGMGISPENVTKIFTRFFQVSDQQQIVEKGTGIGLSLTKDLVELHHGQIGVASNLNIGSRFFIQFPTGNEHFSQSEIVSEESEKMYINDPVTKKVLDEDVEVFEEREETASVRNYVILFVDDNPDISSYVKMNLEKIYKIYIGKNGQEGFDLALKHMPDLIITDVMMPEIDGIELTRKIKKNEITRHIPVILLSARSAIESQREAIGEGAIDYITKPFKIDLLQLKIRSILADREMLHAKYKNALISPSVEIVYSSADEKFMKKLYELVKQNIDEPDFDVDQIVDQIGMSRAQLYRKLNSLTGQSVKEFVRNIRLRSAAELLHKGDLRVGEIMGMVGISNRAYFVKCFKEMYGVNPSDYKSGN